MQAGGAAAAAPAAAGQVEVHPPSRVPRGAPAPPAQHTRPAAEAAPPEAPGAALHRCPVGSVFEVDGAERRGPRRTTAVMALGGGNFEVLAREPESATEQEVAAMVNRMVHWVAFTESVRSNRPLLQELEDFQRECWDKELERERLLRSTACRAPAAQLRRRHSGPKSAHASRAAAREDGSGPQAAAAAGPRPKPGDKGGRAALRGDASAEDGGHSAARGAGRRGGGLLSSRGKGPARHVTSLGAELMLECQGIGAASSPEHGFVASLTPRCPPPPAAAAAAAAASPAAGAPEARPGQDFSFAAALPGTFFSGDAADPFSRKLQELQWLQSETIRQERTSQSQGPGGAKGLSLHAASAGPAPRPARTASSEEARSYAAAPPAAAGGIDGAPGRGAAAGGAPQLALVGRPAAAFQADGGPAGGRSVHHHSEAVGGGRQSLRRACSSPSYSRRPQAVQPPPPQSVTPPQLPAPMPPEGGEQQPPADLDDDSDDASADDLPAPPAAPPGAPGGP
eukprot:TRINITY_DN12288_c0_g1_i1.p1 TRINITY_DN12288_c0_g1~~TRINITY_DN12288_c0_g1_i1.p1  ORF type:complete len:536 (+),score=145.21 TRINITY_DN12288_c0_g1_i1:78-1610(+)